MYKQSPISLSLKDNSIPQLYWVRKNVLVHKEKKTLNNGVEDIENHIEKEHTLYKDSLHYFFITIR